MGPEGNAAPVEGQAMSELASQSFVITSGTGAAETASKDLPATTTSKGKSSKKKSPRRRSLQAAAEELAPCILASDAFVTAQFAAHACGSVPNGIHTYEVLSEGSGQWCSQAEM